MDSVDIGNKHTNRFRVKKASVTDLEIIEEIFLKFCDLYTKKIKLYLPRISVSQSSIL